jgi:hypothetical protein
MNAVDPLPPLVELARSGRLYPGIILHGADDAGRRVAAARLAGALICERAPGERPCGTCRHCRRIDTTRPLTEEEKKKRRKEGDESERVFHPDLVLLERDAKTVTSADAAREALRVAHASPFEARGQVFVVAEADTLSAEAGDALLKLLEEPGLGAPRHFLLLAPSRLDLPATLRSRSLAIYLGAPIAESPEKRAALAGAFGDAVGAFASRRGPLDLLRAAGVLAAAGDFDDPRAQRPWLLAAAAVRDAATAADSPELRRRLVALAEDLLTEAPSLRLRGIPAERLIEGLVSRRLTAPG